MTTIYEALRIREQKLVEETTEFYQNKTTYVESLTAFIWNKVEAQTHEMISGLEATSISPPDEFNPIVHRYRPTCLEDLSRDLCKGAPSCSWLPHAPLQRVNTRKSRYLENHLTEIAQEVVEQLSHKFDEWESQKGMDRLYGRVDYTSDPRADEKDGLVPLFEIEVEEEVTCPKETETRWVKY